MPTLTQITTGQNQKEALINGLFEGVGMGGTFGIDRSNTANLTLGLFGGRANVDGVLITISASTYVLTDGGTHNIFLQRTGAGTAAIGTNNTSFPAGVVPLYTVVTSGGQITSASDHRRPFSLPGRVAKAITTADVTLTLDEATAQSVEVTGTLTGNRSLILPSAGGPWIVHNNGGASAFALTVKTAAGAGVVVGLKARALLYTDGTNIARANSDPYLQDIAYAASITPDASAGDVIDVGTLTGTLTINAPTNPIRGRELTFMFLQDGTGGRVITWDAAFKKGTEASGTANQRGATKYIYDGTNWIQLGGTMAWIS